MTPHAPLLHTPLPVPTEAVPGLLVIVDAEADSVGECRRGEPVAVEGMNHLDRVQGMFDEFGIIPTFVVDHPVASQPEAFGGIRELVDAGRAVIGAHLHPEVTPPYETEEDPDSPGAAEGDLDSDLHAHTGPGLERAKIETLTDTIEENLGVRPVCFKEERRGPRPETVATLIDLGYTVDLSIRPRFDLRPSGGPDFRKASPAAGWLGEGERRLLEIPVTAGHVGLGRGIGAGLQTLSETAPLRALGVPALLARLRILERVVLTPEGFDHAQHRRLVEDLRRRGLRVFTWTFHAPSLMVGGNRHVPDEPSLERFLETTKRFFDYFLGDLGGLPTTPLSILGRARRASERGD